MDQLNKIVLQVVKFNASVSKEEQIHASCEMTGKFARFDQTRNSLLSIPRQF